MLLGMMGRTPFAGVAWQVMHYLEGLRRLGHEVYYVEDTGDWPYDPEQNAITGDPRFTVRYLADLMARVDGVDRWAYCSAADASTYGLSSERLAQIFSRADVLINLTGATVLREEHCRVPIRIYLETDPVLPSIEMDQGKRFTLDLLAAHTHHFSFGENIGTPVSPLRSGPFQYQATRQPIVMDWWSGAHLPELGARAIPRFTTIANWQQTGKDVEWNGETYFWSKHLEFLKFLDLPARAGRTIELALACDDAEVVRMLAANGWRVVDAMAISREPAGYRQYIANSQGEFTVAKDQNVRLRSGWFSDRSACYLAAGRPVITQNTAFGTMLPTGEGLFAFDTMEDILSAFDAIDTDYTQQARSAKEIAETYFRAETVLDRLLEQAGV